MKKEILLLAVLLKCCFSFCQTLHQDESFLFNVPVTGSHIYEGSKSIKFEAGFTYTAQTNESFTAKINPYMLFPPTDGNTGGPSAGNNGIVGNIGGEFNINTVGAATYTLPIDIPKGLNNLQPNLSVLYNSSLGDGYLGMGWTLSVHSAITRVGCNIYNDGKITIPNFGADDKFSLDGKRLMAVDGTVYGSYNTQYKTEIEDFSIIISQRDAGSSSSGPDWFEVRTKSGLIMQYGKTADSRIEPQGITGKTNIWLLNEVKDRMGNYISYHYIEDFETGEYYLDNISYTGNNKIQPNINPFAQIVFQYSPRTIIGIKYLNGCKTTISKLMDKITVKYNNQLYREYSFTYNFNNPNSILTEINLKSSSNENLNPIKFQYSQTFSTPVTENASLPLASNRQSSFADYNGDGLCDLLYIEYPITSTSKWGLKINYDGAFLGTPDYEGTFPVGCDSVYSSYTSPGPHLFSTLNPNVEGYSPHPSYYVPNGALLSTQGTDFNGDGKSDIIIVDDYTEGSSHFIRYNTYYYDEAIKEIIQYNYFAYVRKEHVNARVYLADVDGDMQTDFIIFDADDAVAPIKTILHKKYVGQQSEFTFTNFCDWNINSKVDFADFNGDGKADFMVRNSTKTQIFSFNKSVVDEIYYDDTYLSPTGVFPDFNSKLYLGDFNGDGISDVLEERKITNQYGVDSYYYQRRNFTGKNFISATFPLAPYPPVSDFAYPIYVSDINHDNKSDITLMLYNKLRLYISDGINFSTIGDGFSLSQALDIPNSYYGDFNGDGIVDIYQKSGNIILINKNDKSQLLNAMTDSHGATTKINYDFLTNKAIYSRSPIPDESLGKYDIIDAPRAHYLQIAQPVVSSVETENGLGTFNKKSFTYSGLSIHIEGKGLLGFKSIQSYDNVSYVYNLTENKTNTKYFINLPYKSESGFILSSKIKTNETFYNYSIKDQTNNRIYPALISTLNYNRTPDQTIISTSKTIYEYDANAYLYGNVSKITSLNDETEILPFNLDADDLNKYKYKTVTELQYQSADVVNWVNDLVTSKKVTSKVPYTGSPEISRTTTFNYYPVGNPSYPLLRKSINYAGSNVEVDEEFWYDEVGNLVKTQTSAPNYTDPYSESALPIRETNFEYSTEYNKRFLTKQYNSIFSTETSYYAESGLAKESKDANGLVTYYFYDGFNRLHKTIGPDGVPTTLYYRWKTNQTNFPVNTLFYTWNCKAGTAPVLTFYDKFGRVIGNCSKSFANTDIITVKSYDQLGRIKYVYEPNDLTKYSENKYNSFSQLTQVINPDQTHIDYSYIARGNTVTDALGFSTTKKVNAVGWIEESIDQKNQSIKYEYYADGQVKRTYLNGITGSDILNEYDPINGSQTKTIDPDAGTIEYAYNPFGELIWQKQVQSDSKTIEYTFAYDILGRKISQINNDEGTTNWEYDSKLHGKGLVSKVSNSITNHSLEYAYDDYSRVKTETETIDGIIYVSENHYDVYGRTKQYDYPYVYGTDAVFSISNSYNENGFLTGITSLSDSKKIWQLTDMNIKGQILKYKSGNGIETSMTYYPLTNLPYQSYTYNSSSRILDLSYAWDNNGNLTYRDKSLNPSFSQFRKEEFSYDELNRLKTTKLDGVQISNIGYATTGNIISKTGNIYFTYGENGAGIHAVTSVTIPDGLINQEIQNIQYTSFNKVSHISQGTDKMLDIVYGIDQQRIKQTKVINGISTVKTYVGGMLEKVLINGQTTYYYNITAPSGLCAVYVKPASGNSYLRYIHTDHLGSISAVTDEGGVKVAEYSFDAWGNRRDPLTWQAATGTLPDLFCDRGFTGHEHLAEFGLINMNGRVYDPFLCRMLSPDNYVQAPDFTQNLNRYSYCVNNPLKYTDPSGDFVITLLATLASSYWGGVQSNNLEWNPAKWDFNNPNTYLGIVTGGITGYMIGKGIEQNIKTNKYYKNESRLFFKSCQDAGIDPFDPVSDISDKFLNEYTDKWYPGSPKGLTDKFTVEQTPSGFFNTRGLTGKEGGATDPIFANDYKGNIVFSGRSNVYFNKEIAFRSYRELHRTIGHELVHVSQFGALKGFNTSLLKQSMFREMLEFHAYNFRSTPGIQAIWHQKEYQKLYPILYQNLAAFKFPWTSSAPIFPF